MALHGSHGDYTPVARVPRDMALQAGLPLFDFGLMAGKGKTAYIAAIQAGLDTHYAPIERLFGKVIEQSRSSF